MIYKNIKHVVGSYVRSWAVNLPGKTLGHFHPHSLVDEN
jgi:hypothetical protein